MLMCCFQERDSVLTTTRLVGALLKTFSEEESARLVEEIQELLSQVTIELCFFSDLRGACTEDLVCGCVCYHFSTTTGHYQRPQCCVAMELKTAIFHKTTAFESDGWNMTEKVTMRISTGLPRSYGSDTAVNCGKQSLLTLFQRLVQVRCCMSVWQKAFLDLSFASQFSVYTYFLGSLHLYLAFYINIHNGSQHVQI